MELRINKIDRYEITRKRDTEAGSVVETVVSDLTYSQACELTGALESQAHASEIDCKPVRYPETP